MNITTELLRIVEQAHSLTRILDAATRVIAERMRVEDCFVLLVDQYADLTRTSGGSDAAAGAQPADAEVASIAAQAAAAGHTISIRGETAALLACPMLLRDNLIGTLVLRGIRTQQFSVDDLTALETISGQLVGVVENARIVDALDRGERPVPRGAPRPATGANQDGERILHGVGGSPGVAIGAAVFRGARLDFSARSAPTAHPDVERARVRTAIEKTRNDLLQIQTAAAREIDEEHALIFASHLLLLNDPMVLGRIDQAIAGGMSAPLAIDAVLEEFENRLRLVPDVYIQERIDDIDDLRSRILDHVLDSGRRTRFGTRIVVTARIPPSLVTELKTEGAQGLVTEFGGATSHGVLLARAMGIPMVTGITDVLTSVGADDRLIVDGTTGVVVVRPSDATVQRYEEERRRVAHARSEHAKFRDILARTADGVRVTLQANVGVASDLTVARENRAEGIGLYRTEFPFIVRDAFPTRLEQVRIYRKAYELFPDGPICFRILDLGGDKFVAGGSIAVARSAFHGYRSLRVLFDHPDVLRDQVQALALAAADRPLRILIPMVTSIEDLRRAKEMIARALASIDGIGAQRAPTIGAMIEVPAAVELAADIAKEVDFLSIGTNDLMQYTLIVDREDSRMAPLSDPYHPAILRMIARVAGAAHAAGKPVGVCGEIAARPDVALALIALGIDSLSVVPTAIPELKQALAQARLEPMRRAMPATLALCDASSIAAALRDAFIA